MSRKQIKKRKQTKKDKPNHNRYTFLVLSFMLLFLVIILIIVNNNSIYKPHEKWHLYTLEDENMDCLNVDFCVIANSEISDIMGAKYIGGALSNLTGKRLESISIHFGIYTDKNNKIGDCSADTTFLENRDIWSFTAPCSYLDLFDNATYKLEDISYK